MAELLVPVLAAYLAELTAGIQDLEKSVGDDRRQAAMRLCELSREIRFELGPPSEAPREIVRSLVDLFEQAAVTINVTGDDELSSYADNIRKRARSIRQSARI